MSKWSLPELLSGLHDDIENRLATTRKAFGHPGTKGDASELVWLELFKEYLPQRYQAASAHIVDSKGAFSDQIDVVIFDRQYSPFIFNYQKQLIVPAESVYAVFEAKQSINAKQVAYAQEKIATARRLHRTSLPIPHAGGKFSEKPPPYIFGGILAFESEWNPPLDKPLIDALKSPSPEVHLDFGCVAAHGMFSSEYGGKLSIRQGGKPATAFLFELIARLQDSGTVPMIDVRAYAAWLTSGATS